MYNTKPNSIMSETSVDTVTKEDKPSILSKVTKPLDSLFSNFPLIEHKREINTVDETFSSDIIEDYYNSLKLSFENIYPLSYKDDFKLNEDNNSNDNPKILFISDLKFSENINAYSPITPEDNDAIKSFLQTYDLNYPKKHISDIEDLNGYSKFCIILLSNDTIQMPLVINSLGEPEIEEEADYKPDDIKTLSIILYLSLILSIEDINTRTRYLQNINETYLVNNKVFDTLSENKWHSFYKFLQLNYKNPFLTISLKTWDFLNFIFKKQNQLNKEIHTIKAHLLKKKLLLIEGSDYKNKILNDSHLKTLQECIENDPILKQMSLELDIEL